MSLTLCLSSARHTELLGHLLGADDGVEQAAFFFAVVDGETLRVVDQYLVPPQDFVTQSTYFIELRDEVRALLIKKAHDLGAAIIEIHSHPFPAQAQFSPSDLRGLAELAPHMLWRLPHRPYTALVFGPDSFDALCWHERHRHSGIDALDVDGVLHRPTDLTLKDLEDSHGHEK